MQIQSPNIEAASNVIQHTYINGYQSFGVFCCLHLQSLNIATRLTCAVHSHLWCPSLTTYAADEVSNAVCAL